MARISCRRPTVMPASADRFARLREIVASQRETLSKHNRRENEMSSLVAQSVPEPPSFGKARSKSVTNKCGLHSRKDLRIKQAPVAQLDRASAFEILMHEGSTRERLGEAARQHGRGLGVAPPIPGDGNKKRHSGRGRLETEKRHCARTPKMAKGVI